MTSKDPLVMAQLKQDCFGGSQAFCILVSLRCLSFLQFLVEEVVVNVVKSEALVVAKIVDDDAAAVDLVAELFRMELALLPEGRTSTRCIKHVNVLSSRRERELYKAQRSINCPLASSLYKAVDQEARPFRQGRATARISAVHKPETFEKEPDGAISNKTLERCLQELNLEE
jgi:hypothetical protein